MPLEEADSEDNLSANELLQSAEVRVHGIGDHEYFDALGSPPEVDRPTPDSVAVARAPQLPRYQLRLMAWSRTSRKLASGTLWYVAFPFTLLNVAGNMRPAPTTRFPRVTAGTLFVVNRLVGCLLTVMLTAWMIVILETIFRAVPVYFVQPRVLSAAIVVVCSAIPVAAMAGRYFFRRESRVSLSLVLLQVVSLAAFVATLFVFRPALQPYSGWPATLPPFGAIEMAISRNPGPVDETRYLDFFTVCLLCSMAITLVGALILTGLGVACRAAKKPKLVDISVGGDQDCPAGNSLAAAGLALVLSMAILHSVAALVRIAINWLVDYFFGSGGPGTLAWYDRMLMPFSSSYAPVDFRPDLVPFFGVVASVGIVLSVGVVSILPGGAGWFPLGSLRRTVSARAARAEWVHRFTVSLNTSLTSLFVCFVLFTSAGVSLLVINRQPLTSGAAWVLALTTLHFLTIVAFVFLFFGQPESLKALLARVADVAGFWTVEHHPLAGASYRKTVMNGVAAALLDLPRGARVALVGHSQGSVICAWFVARTKEPLDSNDNDSTASWRDNVESIHLVTCGSPLRSLYATMFPSVFDAKFFAETGLSCASWTNYWRATDPIATPILADRAEDIEIGDPSSRGVLRKHGDYWVEPRQIRGIRRVLKGLPAKYFTELGATEPAILTTSPGPQVTSARAALPPERS